MDKLEFINKLIEDRTDSKERFESYSKTYPDHEVFIKGVKSREKEIETLKQIKTDLEIIESIKQLGINPKDLLKEFIDIKHYLGEVDSDITPDYLAYIVSDGITYRKLSKKLGCDLDVIVKATTNEIIDFEGKKRTVVLGGYYLYVIENDELICGISLKNYQKTWWLKGGENKIKQ